MATLILGTVGRIIGGPIGGLVGTVLGGVVDRAVLGGGGKPREVGRIGNLAVQSAAYGEPIPIIIGRMRCAGNLVWTSGIKERTSRSGGGKRGGSATTTYSYSASFAVALAGRPIGAIGRIWADGKLIRAADGSFTSPVTMRLHQGGESQAVDPLIAAAEGATGAPAYRGLAYAVFEDLPLADYGNRIPNLTFEAIADDGDGGDFGTAITILANPGRRTQLAARGEFPAISGYFAGRSGAIAEAIAPLVELGGIALVDADALVALGGGGIATIVAAADADARVFGDNRSRERRRQAPGDAGAGAVEIAFYDTSRDYQPGLQRVRRDVGGSIDERSIAAAMSPLAAKTLARDVLARGQAARLTATVRLPWRHVGLRPGALVQLSDEATIWRIRATRFEGFVVAIDLERADRVAAPAPAVDGGRALGFDDRPAGPTTLAILDLPPLPGDLPTTPRLWVAAAGASPGWRRAAIEASGDDGNRYDVVGVVEGGATMGQALAPLPAGPLDRWDRAASVEVMLLSEAMWLAGSSPATVLAGANLALIGDEIVQFAEAEAIAPRRFRLSMLLRGRRGTEFAVAGHGSGEAFVMLDPATLLAFDPPLDAVGRTYRFRAAGTGDLDTDPILLPLRGRAVQPLSPVDLRLAAVGGGLVAGWKRRSRAGFGWPDFVDVPLDEAREAYRVDVALDGRPARSVDVTSPAFAYSAADRLADGGGSLVTLTVAQLGESFGPGRAAAATIRLS